MQDAPAVHLEPGFPHTEETVRLALTTMVACGGDAGEAYKLLRDGSEEPLGLSKLILESWRDVRFPRLYAQIAEHYGRELEETVVVQMRELAAAAARVQRKAIERAGEGVEEMTAVEAAKAARDLAHVSGQNVDKLLTLTGRPTEITEERSAIQIARGIMARYPHLLVVDGEAQEEPADAQLEGES